MTSSLECEQLNGITFDKKKCGTSMMEEPGTCQELSAMGSGDFDGINTKSVEFLDLMWGWNNR